MTSVSQIALGDISVSNGDLTATQFINGSSIDQDKQVLRLRINALIVALAEIITDNNTLVDSAVRLFNLDPEVVALLGSGAGNDGTVWQPKVQVDCATLDDITLSGEQTIDDVLTSGSRVLVKDQTLAKNNGIYVSAAGAWTRATDADTAAELGYAMCFVESGTTNGGTSWIGTLAATAITLGTTSIPFARLPAAAATALVTLAGGGTGQTTPSAWPTTRRRAARVASTTEVTLSAPGATIDGVTMAADDRVLLVGQSYTPDNGLWVWNGAATDMTRPVDYAADSSAMAYADVELLVKEGTLGAGLVYRLTTTGAIIIDTTGTAWTAQVNGLSANSVVTASILDAAVTNAKLANMSASRIKGRISTTGAPQDLTGAQVTALLSAFVTSGASAAKGLVPAPSTTAGTDAFLREDASWSTPPLVRDIFRGLKMVNNTATPLAKVDVTADEAVLQTSGGVPHRVSSVSVTVNLAGAAANGLDTGSESTSTWYHVWVIYNPTTATTAGLFSLSATAPTMPSGYTFKAYVGAVYNSSGGDLPKFIQRGNVVSLVTTNVISAFAASLADTYQTLSLSAMVPSTAAIVSGQIGNTTADSFHQAIAADVNGVGQQEFHAVDADAGYNLHDAHNFRVPLITAQQVAWKASITGAKNRIDINGWEYP